jgi:hypothetical protein
MRIWLNRCFDDLQAALGAGMLGADGVRGLVSGTQVVALPATTPLMNAQFARLRGYDPAPWLPVLSGAGVKEASAQDQARFLRDWRRTRADLLNSERFGMIAQVAHERGLKLYGAAPEGTAPDDAMAMRMRADVPMVVVAQAALTGARGAGLAGERRIAEAASVAHVYGQNWVAGEVLPDMGPSAIAPWTVTPRTMRGALDLAFVNGVNRVILPARIGASGAPWFGPQQSWAGLAQGFSDYLARTSLMLQQGHNVADLAELADEEAPRGDAPPRDDAVPPGYARDFVTAAMVDGSLMVDGHDLVSQSGARYRALWLGGAARPMTLRTLARLADLVAAGATVIGPRPLASPALADAQGDAPALAVAGRHALARRAGRNGGRAGPGHRGGNAGVALARMGVAPDFRPVGLVRAPMRAPIRPSCIARCAMAKAGIWSIAPITKSASTGTSGSWARLPKSGTLKPGRSRRPAIGSRAAKRAFRSCWRLVARSSWCSARRPVRARCSSPPWWSAPSSP